MLTRRHLANAIRALSMDAVQQANSGHPGMPMGMADIAEVLWNDFLQHNPNNPHWLNRDRFVISNGHGSMLLYALLHLTGYDLSLNELKHFRQWGSKTPGHPENHLTAGVETTTGPLGQGLANAVGMALSERMLAARFNQADMTLIDHHTYVFLGDGCLMEGISHEACSLAGTFGLGKLIAFWDDNQISIDGKTEGWFTDNTPKRFEAYQWHVIRDVDGHDSHAIKQAIIEAQEVTDKPTLICCKTIIGFGAPNAQGGAKCHGAPLGLDEIELARESLDWTYGAFEIPETIYQAWDARQKGEVKAQQWQANFEQYQKQYPDLAAEFLQFVQKEMPADWSELSQTFIHQCQANQEKMATRKASQVCLNAYAQLFPNLIGGSADLTGSNLTNWSGSQAISAKDFSGNYIHFGVREFGMTAIANGMALYGGFIPYTGTFLTFTDYARNAVRMAALMQLQTIFVYTHDSIGLGEDGPTHQPVEHIAMLRATPNLNVWRPCDVAETAVAWQQALEVKQTPSALLLSRQGLVHQVRNEQMLGNISKGGYILHESHDTPAIILMATGSEVALVMDAAKQLAQDNIAVRVVSMPCMELFLQQPVDYQQTVLPSTVTCRIAVEAGVRMPWYQFVGTKGTVIGLDHFGESAPAEILFTEFGFTVEQVIKKSYELLGD
ncbi:MAG: transketolase [Legionellales bacterium]|nr:transketolase [Legionellales bacterium]